MKINRGKDGIWTTRDDVIQVDHALVQELKQAALLAPKKRARLCAHHDASDRLHEMIIALHGSTYVQPHRHLDKSESFHVIEGRVRIILFRDDGTVDRVIRLGDAASNRTFFYRISAPIYHTLIVESELLVIHETTNGPFVPGNTGYAPWAPAENSDHAGIQRYMSDLEAITAEPDSFT